MRYIFGIASLALFSIVLDWKHAAPNWWVCREGFCRFDQIFTGIPFPNSGPANCPSIVNEDASDPYVWPAYADSVGSNGDSDKAIVVPGIAFCTRLAPVLSVTAVTSTQE